MRLRDVPLAVFRQRGDLLRGLLLVLIFRPAAFVFPESIVWGLAYAGAAAFVVLQASGRYMAQDFKAAFGVTRRAAVLMAIRTHAKRFHEFALQQKTILGRHSPLRFPVHIEAGDEARRILAGPGAFMLAMAHFERTDAAATLFDARVFDGRHMYVVAYKHPASIFLPHPWRTGLQLRQLLRATACVRREGLDFVYLGGATGKLVDKLRTERAMVAVNIDAHWARDRTSSLTRPFAGASQRTFSTGAARLARLGGAPLLLGLPVMSKDGGAVRMQLFGPFRSTATLPDHQDIDVTQQVLDVIECEIGKRPCEYMLDIGGERCWDVNAQTWRSPTVDPVAAPLGAGPG